jgi:hypothetical protein
MEKTILIVLFVVASVGFYTVEAVSGEDKYSLDIDQDSHAGINNIIQFKVNGQPVKTSGWSIRRFVGDGSADEWLNITTNMHEEQRTINVNLCGTRPGNYLIDETNQAAISHGAFFPDFMEKMSDSYSFTKAMFTITTLDTLTGLVNGSFSGTVRNLAGQTLEITEGRIINASLKPGVTMY